MNGINIALGIIISKNTQYIWIFHIYQNLDKYIKFPFPTRHKKAKNFPKKTANPHQKY